MTELSEQQRRRAKRAAELEVLRLAVLWHERAVAVLHEGLPSLPMLDAAQATLHDAVHKLIEATAAVGEVGR